MEASRSFGFLPVSDKMVQHFSSMRLRDGHLHGKYDKYGCGMLVGKNILTVVLEVILLRRLREMRVSVSQETFTNAMCKQNSCRVRHQ